MKFPCFSVLTIISFLSSCSARILTHYPTDILIDSLPVNRSVFYEEKAIFETVNKLGIARNFLLLITPYDNGQILIYDKTTCHHIASFGTKGKGPGEFTFVSYFNQFEENEYGINFWFFDVNLRRFHLQNLNRSILGSPEYIKKIMIPTETMIESSLFYIDENVIVGTGNSKQGNYFSINVNTGLVTWFLLYPGIEMERPTGRGYLLRSETCIKPDKTKIAIAYRFFKRIDVINVRGKLLFSYCLDKDTPLMYKNDLQVKIEKQGISQYCDIYATDNLIYALLISSTPDDYKMTSFKSEIHVFDWVGDPKFRIKTNEPITRIAVDESSNQIFCYNQQSGNISVLRF